jgi:glycosyltransferase involved in cell wall biosynthesis
VLAKEADVMHVHLDYAAMRLVADTRHPRTVIHHHGSMYRKNWALMNAVDADYAGLRLVSNLELTQYGDGLKFLPNTMPVARYRRLRSQLATPHDGFRVAHSPSRRDYKGTEVFLQVCERLRAKGLPVEPVLIENRSHKDSLALKATCDAAFDSFWLGIQCSGLEAAAMGLPVIAGDGFVAGKYCDWLGGVPYTFADNATQLEEALAQLVTDEAFRAREAARVHAYTVHHHDDAAVALRYLDLLDEAFQWRTTLRVAA